MGGHGTVSQEARIKTLSLILALFLIGGNSMAHNQIEEVHFSNGKSFNLVTEIVDGSVIPGAVSGCGYKVSKAMGKIFKIEIIDTSCPDNQIWEDMGL